MFGYRLIHRDVLAHLLRAAESADRPTLPLTQTTTRYAIRPETNPSAGIVPEADPLPAVVVAALNEWSPEVRGTSSTWAAAMLASGASPEFVAAQIRDGDPVDAA